MVLGRAAVLLALHKAMCDKIRNLLSPTLLIYETAGNQNSIAICVIFLFLQTVLDVLHILICGLQNVLGKTSVGQ